MSHAPTLRRGAAVIALAVTLLSASRHGASAPSPQEPASASDRARARRVRVSVVPAGARLWIDGAETSWFGRTLVLGVGQHRIRAEVPGSRCCKTWSGVVRIAGAARGDDPQRLVIPLEVLPAKVVLVDAPSDAQLRCRDIGISSGLGELSTVHMREPEWTGWCEFQSGGVVTRARVRLAAGEINAVPWAE